MDLGDKCKDLEFVTLNSHYDRYDKQNTYLLSIGNLNSGCGGGEFWQRMQTLASHKVRFGHIGLALCLCQLICHTLCHLIIFLLYNHVQGYGKIFFSFHLHFLKSCLLVLDMLCLSLYLHQIYLNSLSWHIFLHIHLDILPLTCLDYLPKFTSVFINSLSCSSLYRSMSCL